MAAPLHEHRAGWWLLLPLLVAGAGGAPPRGGAGPWRHVAYRHRAEGLGAAVEAGGCGRPGVAAVASFNGRTAGDGWGRLNVTTCAGAGFDAREQMFGAGYVEGFVTGLQMELYWTNYAAAEYPPAGAPPAALRSWMASQLAWAREQVDEHAESEPRWAAMGLILAHYDGLVAG